MLGCIKIFVPVICVSSFAYFLLPTWNQFPKDYSIKISAIFPTSYSHETGGKQVVKKPRDPTQYQRGYLHNYLPILIAKKEYKHQVMKWNLAVYDDMMMPSKQEQDVLKSIKIFDSFRSISLPRTPRIIHFILLASNAEPFVTFNLLNYLVIRASYLRRKKANIHLHINKAF